MSALCRRFDISRPTGYKWLRRYRENGSDRLEERSRSPDHSPHKTPEPIAEAVSHSDTASSRLPYSTNRSSTWMTRRRMRRRSTIMSRKPCSSKNSER